MKVLIKNAIITSPSSHNNSTDILIENGVITAINESINISADKIVSKKNLHVSAGWMDCFANFCDPGYEQKETLHTGANAAAAGGFTDVMIIPNTNPAIYNKSQVEYIVSKSESLTANIYPIASVTKNCEGKELSEMYDMHSSGAVAFSDGINSLQSSGILLKALEYIKAVDGTIIQLPDDKNIGANGLMNEGISSVQLGLQSRPSISEEILIARDLELVKYTDSKIHFTGISTKKSLALITKAKEEGLKVSCSVTPYHLFFCDEDLVNYDTNLKVNPPLRNREDMVALRDGIKNNQIDFIASHHEPQHWDDKTCEFEKAKYGMIGLESLFGVAGICGVDLTQFLKMQIENTRKIFGMPIPLIAINEKASLTLFDPDEEYIFGEHHIYSKSRNTPFIDKKLKGKTFGIINGDKLFLNEPA